MARQPTPDILAPIQQHNDAGQHWMLSMIQEAQLSR